MRRAQQQVGSGSPEHAAPAPRAPKPAAGTDAACPAVASYPPRRPAPPPTSPAASAVGRGNRRADTRPELAVRRLLHARGFRYRVDHRLDVGEVRVRPDVVFTRARVAVFIDGCFWHGCPAHGTRPRSNQAYWDAKIARNRARDERVDVALHAAGWRVVRLWEHEQPAAAVAAIAAVLRDGDLSPVRSD